MTYTSKHLLAVCLILALPAALIARPTVSQRDQLIKQLTNARERNFLEDKTAASIIQEEILEQLLHRLTSQEQGREKDITGEEQGREKDITGEELEDEDMANYDAGLYEGDIALTSEDIAKMNGLDTDAEIQKLYSKARKWPEGKVFYSFDDGFPEKRKIPVLEAMVDYENKTCLTFHETTEGQRLNITHRRSGCWSFVGRLTKVQDLSLGKGCYPKGTALHELGHAIGFFHEQNRPDRDHYISIRRENVHDNKMGNFNLKKYTNYQGEPYAFGSIMHYGRYYFTKDKNQPTITVENMELYEEQGEPKLGSRELDEIDIRQINKQYGCYEPYSKTNSLHGSLHVKVLQAGPFQDPAHYYVCVVARDSEKNKVSKCNKEDLMSTTDPEWVTEFVFEPVNPETIFYSFDIMIKEKNRVILPSQTIWVEAKQREDNYYTNKEQSVVYEYEIK